MSGISKLGVNSGIGVMASGTSWASYWATHLFNEADLNLWAKGRSGLTIPDTIGSNNIGILPVCGKFATATTDFLNVNNNLYNHGHKTEIEVEFDISDFPNDTTLRTLIGGYGGVHATWFRIAIVRSGVGVNPKIVVIMRNDNAVVYCSSVASTTSLTLGIHKIKWIDNNGTVSLVIDGVTDASVYSYTVSDTFTLDYIGIGYVVTTYFHGKIFYTTIKWDDVLKASWHFTGRGLYEYDEANAYNLTWYGTGVHYGFSIGASSYLLDSGWSLWRKAGQVDEIVPYGGNTSAIVAAGYTLGETHAGSLTEHNCADSCLNIPVAQWDKADTNIFENAVRSGVYYDATNTDLWHISQLDYLLFSQNCKTSHKGLDFLKITDNSFVDRKILKEIFSYTTDKTGNDLQKILQYVGDKVYIDAALQLYCDAAIEQDVNLILAGVTGVSSLYIYWGDGTRSGALVMDGTVKTVSHSYSGTSVYPLYVFKPENILKVQVGSYSVFELAPLNGNIEEFNKCINMTKFYTQNNYSKWTGSFDGFPVCLEELTMYGVDQDNYNETSGDITKFVNLKKLMCWGKSTWSGNISGLTALTNVYISGNNTISGSIVALVNSVQLEGQGTNTLTGNIEGLVNLSILCLAGNNSISGSVSALTTLTYLSCGGTNTLSGSVSALINLWYLGIGGLNTITGSLTNLTLLEHYLGTHGVIKPANITNNSKLCAFTVSNNWIATSADLNQWLADFWANRDVARAGNTSETVRSIDLRVGGGVQPTGQGLVDKAALQAYRSPTPPGTAALWTVLTN